MFSKEPNVGFVIIRTNGFALAIIIGFDPCVFKIGDLAIGVMCSRFFVKATIWIKIKEGLDGRHQTLVQTQ